MHYSFFPGQASGVASLEACVGLASAAGGVLAVMAPFGQCSWCLESAYATGFQATGSCGGNEVLAYAPPTTAPPPLAAPFPLWTQRPVFPTPAPGQVTRMTDSTYYGNLPQKTLHVGDTFTVNFSANQPWESALIGYTMRLYFNTSAFAVTDYTSVFGSGAKRLDVVDNYFIAVAGTMGVGVRGYQPMMTLTLKVNSCAAGASWAFKLVDQQTAGSSLSVLCGTNGPGPCAPGQLTDFRGGWNGVGYVNVV